MIGVGIIRGPSGASCRVICSLGLRLEISELSSVDWGIRVSGYLSRLSCLRDSWVGILDTDRPRSSGMDSMLSDRLPLTEFPSSAKDIRMQCLCL